MKILIAAGIFPPDPGGPAVHAQAQYVGFRKLGHETKLSTLSHYRRWPRGIRHLLYFFSLFIKSLSTQVVYGHDSAGVGLLALIAARLTGNFLVLRVGGDLAWERAMEEGQTGLSMNEWYESGGYKHDRYYRISRFVLRRADALVVVAPLLKNIYMSYYGVSGEKIHVVPNPLLEKKTPASPVGQKIIFASRLVAYKNLERVLKVMAEVLPHFRGAQFIIMGDGPERAKLEALAHSLGLSSQVVFKGTLSQAEVVEITRDALFALAPAFTEFNPNYVLQALSYGKPFLISRENGLPFEAPEEFLFSSKDEGELGKKLAYLLTKDGYENALRKVRGIGFQMSWEEVLKENERVIMSLK